MQYFGGLTSPEAAQALGISVTTANRYWADARVWLQEALATGRSSTAEWLSLKKCGPARNESAANYALQAGPTPASDRHG
jgi:hypothetical protein